MSDKKENYKFERSSGYPGYRNTITGDWIYEEEYNKKFNSQKYTKEQDELIVYWAKQMIDVSSQKRLSLHELVENAKWLIENINK